MAEVSAQLVVVSRNYVTVYERAATRHGADVLSSLSSFFCELCARFFSLMGKFAMRGVLHRKSTEDEKFLP